MVKQDKSVKAAEDDDDDELEIVGYTGATILPVAIQEVKREPPSTPLASPKNRQEQPAAEEPETQQKEVSVAEDSTRGTPLKNHKKKVVSKVTEEPLAENKSGESSSQSTPQKEQKQVKATDGKPGN